MQEGQSSANEVHDSHNRDQHRWSCPLQSRAPITGSAHVEFFLKRRKATKEPLVQYAQREACAGAGPSSSGTSGSREARRCPVGTSAFLQVGHDPLRNFGLGGGEGRGAIHAQINASIRLECLIWRKEQPHTLPRWPCTRRTITTVVVIATIIPAAATTTTATSSTAPSRLGLSSARGLTRRLRLRDLGALRRGRRRVWWMLYGGSLFSFLFSLDCLRHTKMVCEGEWGKGRKEGRTDRSVGMFNSQHPEKTRPGTAAYLMFSPYPDYQAFYCG